jgi:antitoxin VapB
MKTARLFINGGSQAVRLPKDCRFSGRDVYVKKFEGLVILFSKDDPWAPLLNSLDQFSDDFMLERKQPPRQGRRGL